MPRKNQSKSAGFIPFEFVRCRMGRDEKAAFASWAKGQTVVLEDLILSYLENDVKISFSMDGKNNAIIVSFTPRGDESINAGRCLTSRAPDALTAFMVNVFKDREIFGGGYWEHLDGDDDIS